MDLMITPQFTQSRNVQNRKNSQGLNILAFPAFRQNLPANSNLAPLARDTVSFGGGNTLLHHLECAFENNTPRLKRIATVYLDVLESVATQLKDKGFSFDRAYCELHPVKSPEAYVDKVSRSRSFDVRDQVRSTMYCRNINDLSVLVDGLLPEMAKRGYVLADTKMSVKDLMKRGYKPTAKEMADPSQMKTVKDLDIRLDDVGEQVLILPPDLRYSIGKPQKSGYEDIQMRFVRDFANNKKSPVMHELIILAGPNTAMAKGRESEFVYSNLRKFDELHMKFSADATPGSDEHKASRYIELVQRMFRGKVSQKEFENAKNKDLYDIVDEIPISFSEMDELLLTNYFKGLTQRLSNLYANAKKSAESISEKRQLTKECKEDISLLEDIETGLHNTIEHYNSLNKASSDVEL